MYHGCHPAETLARVYISLPEPPGNIICLLFELIGAISIENPDSNISGIFSNEAVIVALAL